MSVIYDYFSAASDDLAVTVLTVDGGPTAEGSGFDTASEGGIDPVVQLGTLESLLTGTPYDDVTEDPRAGLNLAMSEDYDQIVITVTDALATALAAVDDARLAEVAVPWSQTDELAGADPADLAGFLRELAALARGAEASGHRLYCWVCI